MLSPAHAMGRRGRSRSSRETLQRLVSSAISLAKITQSQKAGVGHQKHVRSAWGVGVLDRLDDPVWFDLDAGVQVHLGFER